MPTQRRGGVVPCQAHNLEALVQFQAPQHISGGVAQRQSSGIISHWSRVRIPPPLLIWARSVAWFNTPPCHGGDRRFKSGRARQ